MTTTELATLLLWLMPVSVAFRTLVYAGLTIVIARQRNIVRLDWAILALFATITASGIAGTALRWFIYRQAQSEDIDNWTEWSIVVAIVVFPIIESIAGMLVLAWSRELDRTEPTNQRQDIREKNQNDERKSITAQQIDLNIQRVGMDEVQVSMNAQQAGMDERQKLADTRQEIADTRQGVADTREGLADTRESDADTRQGIQDDEQRRQSAQGHTLDDRERDLHE